MRIEIMNRHESGTCALSGKKDTEVFSLRLDNGNVQHVCTQRLPEVLRVLCSVGDGAGSPAEEKTSTSL